MADQAATVSTADGIAKRVHGKVRDMIPSKILKFTNRVKYDKSREVGLEYAEQVWLTREHGFTAGGTTGARRNLNASNVAVSKLAKLTPASHHFRSEMVIELMAQAESAGPKAFERYISAFMRNAKKGFDHREEVKHLYGGSPIGVVDSATDVATTSVMTINPGRWIPAVWLGSKNMKIDAYDGATLLNTLGPLEVSVVDVKLKKITVTGAAADIDALVAAGADTDLYYEGQKGLDGLGLRSICGLTASSSDYLNISCATFSDVWNATQVTWDYAATEFSWGLFNDGLIEAANRGQEGDLIAQCPYEVWKDLCGSLDALRVLDSSYSASKGEMGHDIDALTFHGPTGKVTVEASMYASRGEVMVYPDPSQDSDGIARIGTSEPTFELPSQGGKMLHQVHGTNAVEYGMYACSGLWLPAPRNTILFAA